MCSFQVKRCLFQTYLTNMYCAHLWSSFTAAQLQKVKVAYNNALREVFKLLYMCSIREMCVSYDIPMFDMFIWKSVYSIEVRL